MVERASGRQLPGKCRRPALFALTALWVLLLERSAMPQTPVALALETSGTISPEVTPFSEITLGTALNLGESAQLVFDDYRSCRQVTVTGGRIEFGPDGYKTSAAARSIEAAMPCKQEVVLEQGGEPSTLMARDLKVPPEKLQLATRPSFVLVGARSQFFAAVRIAGPAGPIRTVALTGARFDWPADAASLGAGMPYELSLIPKSASQSVSTAHFVAVEEPDESQRRPLVIIRVE